MKKADELYLLSMEEQAKRLKEKEQESEKAIAELEEYIIQYMPPQLGYGYLDIHGNIVDKIGYQKCIDVLVNAGFAVERRKYLFDSHPLTIVFGKEAGFTDVRPSPETVKKKTFWQRIIRK